ncbi:hypothetical protein BD309DRAFT_853685 [Dichomitus squalens]|uniref:uncharacterized protein n=1 Tax=Dichomitus squalens (strain LYAD-421) TaxID=732165 RepID=UPI0004412DAC|nr:uncharacterized protein DICSQDRAFT_179295 [Dichomitus squalens LYAD-421 SS1]EJF63298.1 hypothetical protein DICSQDRAFT_179295 [Dichomitus squalens LYAD-421 SS1]TBU48595.1 hypothetical protein BD309DRAFT_853685 [Dichomitus squalens]
MSQNTPSESRASTSSKSTVSSLTTELDKLTTAVLEVTDHIQACSQASDAHHAAYIAHVEEQKKRTAGIQDRIAQMLAMTQESLKRDEEEPLKGALPHRLIAAVDPSDEQYCFVASSCAARQCPTPRNSGAICSGRRSGPEGTRTRRRGRPCWRRANRHWGRRSKARGIRRLARCRSQENGRRGLRVLCARREARTPCPSPTPSRACFQMPVHGRRCSVYLYVADRVDSLFHLTHELSDDVVSRMIAPGQLGQYSSSDILRA